ncbi:MAG TPA: serine/threonine-protein kinase [Gemmataceae bacterium]|nr:serine/threonine-protein kinase [Gemmataceae bacterium]
MAQPQELQASPEPAPLLQWIDAEADRFEAAWRSGTPPTLAAYIGNASREAGRALLIELIKIDMEWRRRTGMERSLSDYADEFPQLRGADQSLPEELLQHTPAGSDVEETGPFGSAASQTFTTPAEQASGHAPGKFGKYTVLEKLGEGGQAIVYRVLHPELGKEMVLKWHHLPVPPDPELRQMFLKEGKLLASLEPPHPNLVTVYDAGFEGDHPFVLMEYVRGRTLEQYAQTTRPDPMQAARLVAQVARAVAYVHARGITHRDLKPRNLLIDEHGSPRLIDFGLAQLHDAWSAPEQPEGGTPAYMAPEQARGEDIPGATQPDVFALGGVLYFLLVGKAPFAATSSAQALQRARRGEVDGSALIEARVPSRLRKICLRALAANPSERYARAEDLAADLERCAGQPRRRRLALIAAAVLLLVLAAVGWGVMSYVRALPEPATLDVRVWRQNQVHDLTEVAPLQPKDELRVLADLPEGTHPVLLMITTAGKLEVLEPGTGDSTNELLYPQNTFGRLPGPTGTVAFLVCVSRWHPVDADEARALWGDNPDWPSLPEGTVLQLHDGHIDAQHIRGVFEPTRSREDPELTVRERLERFGRALSERFRCRVTGLVFRQPSG